MVKSTYPRQLRQRLKWLWDNRTHDIGAQPQDLAKWRYVPQSLNGGTGWGVFDRVQERFLSNDELLKVPMDKLQAATHLS